MSKLIIKARGDSASPRFLANIDEELYLQWTFDQDQAMDVHTFTRGDKIARDYKLERFSILRVAS